MHTQMMHKWKHSHDFAVHNDKGERGTRWVLLLTAVTMLVEIVAGSMYGSMALLADGWHMGTHVAAFVIALFAYAYSRKYANSSKYSFGTGKVNVLGGFASAVALAVVALMMVIESLHRFFQPHEIQFNEAIAVAFLGLLINVASVFLLHDDHHHEHHGEHAHAADTHAHHHHDHNLRAAYMHVLADAMTSLMAIIALVAGKYLGWAWMDALMGVVGGIIVTRWSYSLLRQTSPILLDASMVEKQRQAIYELIENDADNRIADLHLWKVGAHDYAAIISLVTHYPNSVEHYRALLKPCRALSHITIEVNVCREVPCVAAAPVSDTSLHLEQRGTRTV